MKQLKAHVEVSESCVGSILTLSSLFSCAEESCQLAVGFQRKSCVRSGEVLHEDGLRHMETLEHLRLSDNQDETGGKLLSRFN